MEGERRIQDPSRAYRVEEKEVGSEDECFACGICTVAVGEVVYKQSAREERIPGVLWLDLS